MNSWSRDGKNWVNWVEESVRMEGIEKEKKKKMIEGQTKETWKRN